MTPKFEFQKIGKFALTLALCLFSIGLMADENDGGAIFEAGVSKKYRKTLQLSLSEEIRTKSVLNEVDRLGTEVGAVWNHRRFKAFKLGLSYSFLTYFEHNKVKENRHRITATAQYKYSLSVFDFTLRTRIFTQFRDESRGDYFWNPKCIWRNRLKAAYNVNRQLTPYASVELSSTVGYPKGDYLQMLRYQMGAEYSLNRKSSVELYLRISDEMNVKKPVDMYQIGVGYNFKL